MPALTFDDLAQPVDGQGADGVTRITVRPAGQQSRALTFDDIVSPEGAGDKALRYAKDIGRSAISGLDRGVAELAGLPATAMKGTAWVSDYLQSKITGRPQEEIAQEADARAIIPRAALEPYTGAAFHRDSPLKYDPQTTPGKYAETAASFVPAAVLGPGSVARNATVFGVIPGLASEAAGQATEGTPIEPFARAGAAIATGVGGALLSRPATAQQSLRAALPDYVTQAHIDRAQKLMEAAGNRGIALTWPEALSKVTGKPVLTDMQRILESAGASRTRMQDFMGERPQQIDRAALNTFDNIAPGTSAPSAIGRETSAAAQDAITDVRNIINKNTDPYYKAAEGVLLNPQEMAQVRAIPGYEEAKKAVRSDPQLNRYVAHLPENSVGFLNEVKKYFDQQGTNAASKFNPLANQQRAAGYSADAATARQIGIDASPEYEVALGVQAQTRKQFLEPLMAGPLGKVANAPETKDAINALFPRGPLPNSHTEVATAVSAMAKRNPMATMQLVRAHAEQVFNEATASLQGGANQFGGAKFAKVIAGNPQQRENLKAAVEALPGGRGRWADFEKFLEIVEATGTRQQKGSLTAFNAQDLAQSGGGSLLAEGVKLGLSPGKWWSVVNDKWTQWQAGRNLDQLAQIITDPRSAALLKKVASAPRGSGQQGAAAARVILQSTADMRARLPQGQHQ